MSGPRTENRRPAAVGQGDVLNGILAGLVGGAVFGVVMHALGDVAVVGQLVGSRDELVGWITLLFVGVVGAVVYYLWVGAFAPLRFLAAEPRTGAALGLAFGVLVWFTAIVVVPLWLGLFGIALSIPYVHAPSFIGLLVYGAIVGVMAPLITTYVW